MSDIQRVGVVGCGLMGAGIAEVCARADLDVVVAESDQAGVERGRSRLADSLGRAVAAGKIDGEQRRAALDRLRFTTDLEDLADRQLVVEAVAEREQLKADIFARLDKVVEDRDAVLASNTSSIPVMKLGMATGRPGQVLGIHFFNPVPVLGLVELVPSLLTADRTRERAERFVVDTLGKQVITAGDRDLVGLDTVKAAAEAMYQEFKEPLYSPPPLLQRLVDAGLLGRKTGRGFHSCPSR